ncbi:MAG TPA: glycosyl hydrolase [Thermoanaerobaculia bacterium]|nr:glycosyl hydrolase [Thermoanaerobaculia bacterium]
MKRISILLTFFAATTLHALDATQFKALEWRNIGPYRGGRVAAVEGIASQPKTYYFGGTGGGVWKTTDGGETWKNVSDGFFGGSIGAVAVSDWDPNVVYAGGGEKTVRGNVSHGDGMWKSTDAGKTWTFVGLKDSRHIPRIRIHPRNPDLVYAAVLGHLFGPSRERGVYRTKDGGKTWERVLFANENAGAIDLILDPTNPRIVYASTWRVRRTPYSLESGGEGSALWKSNDGGDTWKNISRGKGLPSDPARQKSSDSREGDKEAGPTSAAGRAGLGIIGVTVSPSNPQNVYAIIEAAEGGVFRSRDGGETWEKTNESRDLRQRAWYYTRIYADPKDEDTVYVPNVRFHKSKDGGKSFTTIATPHGDNHDLWIAPNDPLRMVEGNDGGANVTNDGGRSWTGQENQPTAQFYRVSTDNSFPYRILGAQQDNSAVRIRHRSTGRGISRDDWQETAGGESGHIVAKPDHPDLVYGGSYGGYLTMYNHDSEEFRDVNPLPDNPMGHGAEGAAERFQWNFPLLFSPHDANTLYAASQHLFRSTNGGASWERISGDLTRNDKSKMGPSGGPITKDNTSVEYYGTIFAVAESSLERGVLWTGSDDGLIHVSRDNGATWKNVTPPQSPLPARRGEGQGEGQIMWNSIDPSPFDKGTVYVAGTKYKSDDFRPYLYKTTDYGATWTKITSGIASEHFTRVVRSDKRRKGLLYAGTERGMYVSFDDGASWQSLQLNLPIVPITDLAVCDDDLIAATQGRAFWILDDVTPLQQYASDTLAKRAHLFAPRAAWRMFGSAPENTPRNQGKNAPPGVIVNYWIHPDTKAGTKVKLAFLDAAGAVIRELEGEVPTAVEEEKKKREEEEKKAALEKEPPQDPEEKDLAAEKEKEKNKLKDVRAGFNRFAWDLRYPEAKKFEGLIMWGGDGDGPRVIPGAYTVRLTVGEEAMTTTAQLRQDPRTSATADDLKAQFDFLLAARNKLTEMHEQIERIRTTRKALDDLRKRAKGNAPIVDAAKALDKKMTAVEEALYQTKNRSAQDPLNFPIRLNDKLAGVASSAEAGDFAPTAQQRAVYAQLVQQIDAELAKLREVWEKDVPALNKLVKESEVPAIR